MQYSVVSAYSNSYKYWLKFFFFFFFVYLRLNCNMSVLMDAHCMNRQQWQRIMMKMMNFRDLWYKSWKKKMKGLYVPVLYMSTVKVCTMSSIVQ